MFKMNADNQLVTATGQQVMGYGVDEDYNVDSAKGLVPVSIPLGSAAVAQATQNVNLEGTLSPTGTVATQGTILETGELSDGLHARPTDLTTTQAVSSSYPTFAAAEATGGGTMAAGAKY